LTASKPISTDRSLLSAGLWLMAIRPRTLTMALVPVLLGTALAWQDGARLDVLPFAVALLTALLIQAGTNLFNDAADAQSGNDGPDRLGPPRVTGLGLATAAQVRRSAWLLFLLALAGGVYLVAVGGWGILLIGLASLAAGWAYSGGPRPLSHTPWGESFVILFFGIVAVAGSFYLQRHTIEPYVLWVGLAIGLPAAAVLLLNNIRDHVNDSRAGRRTLVQHLGPRAAGRVYAVLLLLPFPILLAAFHPRNLGLAWLVLPFCVWLIWRLPGRRSGEQMNAHLGHTALAQVLLGVMLIAQLDVLAL
jgi:1,4-dihydroxy-2-naphthoate octaprenyltransferase